MKKDYQNPTTKVVNVNVKNFMEANFLSTSAPTGEDTATEAPLF